MSHSDKLIGPEEGSLEPPTCVWLVSGSGDTWTCVQSLKLRWVRG